LKRTDVKLLNTFGNEDFVFPRAVVTMYDHYVISDVGKHRITLHDENGRIIRISGMIAVLLFAVQNWCLPLEIMYQKST